MSNAVVDHGVEADEAHAHDDHAHPEHTGWAKWVVEKDNKLPFILIGVAIGALVYTLGEKMHWHWPHLLHNEWVHFASNHVGMWFFFTFLGLEITISSLKKAGRFAGLATLGGMVFPPLFCYALTGNWYIAIGACATDVAFSLGAAKVVSKGDSKIYALLVSALLILAVGDDLGGVVVLAGLYASGIAMSWLVSGLISMVIGYFTGERGVITIFYELDDDGVRRKIDFLIQVKSVVYWIIFGIINTAILYFAGVEWLLGGCLVYIFAPPEVKHRLEHVLAPFIPLILMFFGMVNGAIDVLDPKVWGIITLGSFVGGMGGKQLGIFFGGLAGRAWARKGEGDVYANIPTSQIYGLSLFASCNGTVAIFFVAMGAAKGFIGSEAAAQATLGFFLTVPAVYLITFILVGMGILKDDPNFQPSEEPEIDPLFADNPEPEADEAKGKEVEKTEAQAESEDDKSEEETEKNEAEAEESDSQDEAEASEEEVKEEAKADA